MKTRQSWTKELYESVVAQRNNGMTLKAIGDNYGLSVERIRKAIQIYQYVVNKPESAKTVYPKAYREIINNS